jgi:hypothetical protein
LASLFRWVFECLLASPIISMQPTSSLVALRSEL